MTLLMTSDEYYNNKKKHEHISRKYPLLDVVLAPESSAGKITHSCSRKTSSSWYSGSWLLSEERLGGIEVESYVRVI